MTFFAAASQGTSPELTLLKAALVIVASTIIYGIYLGFSDKAVFYYNRKDVAISFAPYISVAVGAFLAMLFQESTMLTVILLAATAISSSYAFGYSAYNAHRYNGGLLWKAIPITLAKIFMAFIFLFNLLGAFNDKNPKRTESIVWTFLIGWLITHLVNGERILVKNYIPTLAA